MAKWSKRVWLWLLVVVLAVAVLGAGYWWQTWAAQSASWGPPPSLPRSVTDEGYQALGTQDAVLDLYLYEDFASPQSKRLHDETEPQFLERYVAHNMVRFISIPIAAVSGDSFRAAEAALCMAKAGKYWAYRDVLYAYQGKIPFTRENLAKLATRVGVSRERFYACYDLRTYHDRVRQWSDQAKQEGVQGAPTYKIEGIGLIPGFRPFDDPDMPGLSQILDAALLEVMAK